MAENCSVLVVDDEDTVRRLIARLLEKMGHTVTEASGSDEALDIMNSRSFDILLTDHKMPGKSGLDLLIETNRLYPDMVKIMFTGMGGQDLYRELINREAVFSVLEKPITGELLSDTVERAFSYRLKRIRERNEIRDLQEKYHTIFDNTTDLIQSIDTLGKFIYVNPAWHKVMDYDQKDLADITLFDLVHEDYRLKIMDTVSSVMTGSMTGSFDTVMISKNGLPVFLEGSATPQRRDGSVVAIGFIFRDVTERHRAEQEIQARLRQETMIARIAHLLANADEPRFVFPFILEIVGECAQADRAYIYSLDEGKQAFEKVDTWCASPYALDSQWDYLVPYGEIPEIYKKIRGKEVIVYETMESIRQPDRRFMEQHMIESNLLFPIRAGTSTVGILGFDTIRFPQSWEDNDISMLRAAVDIIANAWTRQQEIDFRKQKEREAEQSRLLVIRADRLAAVGTMTTGIIHEITQPLNAINVSTQTILYGLSRGWLLDDTKVTNSLNLIVEQIRRMNDIIINMRAFARDGLPTAREMANLNVQVERVHVMLGEQMKAHGIDFELNLGDIPDNEMNTQQILQVILNLVTNARQAVDEIENDQKKIIVTTTVEDSMVVFEISDNGPGVPSVLHEKIFDPFFTTKEVGQGTGLGLSISSGIVHDHNGILDIRDNEMGGATFIMKLPFRQNKG
ncbi:response regulator [bacterium]|nr:response regulator [bacterium]